MLKKDVKTIKTEFILTSALSQLSFVQFRPCATQFLGFFPLTLMSKRKKTLDTSLDHTPSFKTSVDAMVEGLVSNVGYLENRCHNFIQKKYGRKRRLPCTRLVLWTVIFLFYTIDDFYRCTHPHSSPPTPTHPKCFPTHPK